jgi:hypothetical protein
VRSRLVEVLLGPVVAPGSSRIGVPGGVLHIPSGTPASRARSRRHGGGYGGRGGRRLDEPAAFPMVRCLARAAGLNCADHRQ